MYDSIKILLRGNTVIIRGLREIHIYKIERIAPSRFMFGSIYRGFPCMIVETVSDWGEFDALQEAWQKIFNIVVRRLNTLDKKYDEEFGPDSHIDIKSNFDEILIDYGSRNEKRNWIQGIDLRTFLENNGVYPTNDQVLDMINSMNTDNARDLGPHNLILNGHELLPIDQDDKFDDVNTKEKLKSFLIQSGLL